MAWIVSIDGQLHQRFDTKESATDFMVRVEEIAMELGIEMSIIAWEEE